jgi:hypothetical protein
MQHNGWDHALKVTADGAGLAGHAGPVLLRKAGQPPVLDRGIVLVSMAAAIALGAASMSDIADLRNAERLRLRACGFRAVVTQRLIGTTITRLFCLVGATGFEPATPRW